MEKKLIFDITPIIEGNLDKGLRAGIYNATLNIFQNLKLRKVNMKYYCVPWLFKEINEVIDCSEIINYYKINIVISLIWSRLQRIKSGNGTCSKIITVFQIVLSHMAVILDNILLKCDDYNTFLSIRDQAPAKILNNDSMKKYIVLHDTIAIEHREMYSSFNAWYMRLYRTMTNDEIYLANSEQTRRDFLRIKQQLSAANIYVNYHACSDRFRKKQDISNIDAVKEKYDIPVEKKYIFSLCSIEPRKNLIRVVDTFYKFIKKNDINDLVLVLGGKTWSIFEKEFRKVTNGELSEMKCIKQIGYVDDEDLPALYSGAEWFVYTSQYEGFGVPVLEAMSCGCPVIASDNSSLPEVVGDSGILIPWDSDDAHIKAYESYYYNSELRRENGMKGKKRSLEFSWDKHVDRLLEIMNQC